MRSQIRDSVAIDIYETLCSVAAVCSIVPIENTGVYHAGDEDTLNFRIYILPTSWNLLTAR